MKAKWPRWLVPNWSSNPSCVSRRAVYLHFDSLEALTAQVMADAAQARALLLPDF